MTQSLRLLVVALGAVAACFAAEAQDVGLILRGGQVNETALMEALDPPKGKTKSPIRTGGQDRKALAHMLMTFDTNSTELTPESMKMLDALGRVMQAERMTRHKFTIEGHADPRGGEQFNLDLSRRRADAVVSYLERVHGIDPSRLEAVGKGQAELLNREDPFSPENRRVTVKTKDTQTP